MGQWSHTEASDSPNMHVALSVGQLAGLSVCLSVYFMKTENAQAQVFSILVFTSSTTKLNK